jgi:hypothetical protein
MRAGSTWLNVVLGAHSWAANLGEYFRPFLVPGHVACRLCEADGRVECSVLGGIEHVAPADAYHFAADRTRKSVLIDASKRLDWCERFLHREDIDARLIHLVRHPCGFIESERRRTTDVALEELLGRWERGNADIEAFVARSGAPNILSCYDDLADHPAQTFPALCAFLGHRWEPAALSYWNVPHHGLGGNGAASLYLKGRSVTNYVTGDDAYYGSLHGRAPSADRRWKDRLPSEFCGAAAVSPYAVHLAQRLGRGWET